MGLFTPEDNGMDWSVRQTGFNRYKQLLSFCAGDWLKINLLTVAGALPLAAGIILSILTSSILVLLPCSLLGGMLFGPFLAGLYDAVLRGLRDAPGNWWTNYRRSWRQNGRDSLLPGAILGLITGAFSFMAYMLWVSGVAPTPGTVALVLFAGLLFLLLNSLYWPQLVLFRQSVPARLRNIVLFTAKYLWRVLGVSLLQLAYLLLYVLFAPWTVLLVPLLGFWYIVFLAQLLLYGPLDRELHIEERFAGGA